MLYSILLELMVRQTAVIPVTMGHLAHALFLNLVKRFDAALASRLHDEPGYRPFTVSPLSGGTLAGERIALRRGQRCRLRITLFDDGVLWHALQMHFLEAGPIYMRLGEADLHLARMLITPTSDTTNWAGSTDWQTLITLSAQPTITFHFSTATAFSLGKRQFYLFPEPRLVWDSLLRAWNKYAPDQLHMEKRTVCESFSKEIAVTGCALLHAW